MNTARLRHILRNQIGGLKDLATRDRLPELCRRLGIPFSDHVGSKREAMEASLDLVQESELTQVARRFLERHPPSIAVRNEIQELLWEEKAVPSVDKRCRREIARALDGVAMYGDAEQFQKLLDELWDLGGDSLASLFGSVDQSLRAEIQRHVFNNPGDWTSEELFRRLGAFDATNSRFVAFVEGLTGGDVQGEESGQVNIVNVINHALSLSGLLLRESGVADGYPLYSLVSMTDSISARVKNVIFASASKPDLRFRDAVSNDVEIVTRSDEVLVYDRPIGQEGLRWRDLQGWWMDANEVSADEAKKSLYQRLRGCLPVNSPPQQMVFDAFHRGFRSAIPNLPALMPEVWLHWDPIVVKLRGRDALLRQRMDFLMLLPNGVRVVIEVDGKQHYANEQGMADSGIYGKMMSSDRDLKLAGYHVFRFGGAELQGTKGEHLVKDFFDRMFVRFGIQVPNAG